jgi:ABC-type multidrug transport system fused ATPase/permease subunit
VGRVITRVINDVGTLREFITWAVLAIVRNLLGIVGTLIAMLTLNFKLSLLTFAVLPFMVLATVLFRKVARKNYRKVRAAVSWTNSVLAENVNGVRVVQAFRVRDTTTIISAASSTAIFSKPAWTRRVWLPCSPPWWTCSARWQPRWSCISAARRYWVSRSRRAC